MWSQYSTDTIARLVLIRTGIIKQENTQAKARPLHQ